MDDDVKLSMQQAHEKWMAKAIAFTVSFVLILLFGTIAFWIHECNIPESQKPCSEVVIDPQPLGRMIACPDARQRLTFPSGWTMARCSCPESPEPQPAKSR